MRKIVVVLFFVFSSFYFLKGQTFLIEEEFNNGTTAPGGWTFTAIVGTYTSSANFGKSSPSLQFDHTNDRVLTSAWLGTADQLTFYMRGINSPNTSDIMLVEGWDGSAWNTIGNARPYTTSRTFVFTLASNISQLRFTYTKGNTNVAFDDVTVRTAGMCISPMTITSLMIDACDAGTSCEGRDEFITFRNSNVALDINDFEISYPDVGSSGGCTYCGTVANAPCDNTITTNTTYTANLNSTATPCNPFLDPPAGIIPPNADVIVFGGSGPNFTYDFSSLCASGVTYYAIYANNTSDCNGRFGNEGSCPDCMRDVFIRNRATGCTDTTYYNQSLLNTHDGAFTTITNGVVSYNWSGSSCSTFTILPIELLSFTGEKSDDAILLNWQTATETNNNFFTVERSNGNDDFQSIGTVNGSGTTTQLHSYSLIDKNPIAGYNYYRLKQTDYNGQFKYSNAIAVDFSKSQSENELSTWNCESGICYSVSGWNSEVDLQVYDMTGKLLQHQKINGDQSGDIPLDGDARGIYILKFSSDEFQQVKKVWR